MLNISRCVDKSENMFFTLTGQIMTKQKLN